MTAKSLAHKKEKARRSEREKITCHQDTTPTPICQPATSKGGPIMLICVQCGDITQDPNFEYDNDTGDVFSLCPACGCYTLEDAFLCHGCHQWHPGEHQQDGFCPACAAAAATEWKRHNDAFFQGKPPKLRDLINTIMDGETL